MFKFLAWLCMAMAILHLASPRRHHVDYCKRKCPAFDPSHGSVLLPGPQKNLFYKCNFGIGILFSCPRGTYFNPKKNVCDWPRNARAVRCYGSPDYIPEGSGDFEGRIRI